MRTFQEDYRQSNPALHKLYVGYALETLRAVDTFLEELYSHSRVTSSIIAGAVQEHKKKLILEEAAYFEAAALIAAGADTREFDVVEEDRTTMAAEKAEVPAEEPVRIPSVEELVDSILNPFCGARVVTVKTNDAGEILEISKEPLPPGAYEAFHLTPEMILRAFGITVDAAIFNVEGPPIVGVRIPR